ncbi:hypothetical protein HK096_001064, partial [Nowakowskiella sp. JEL0078]
MGKRNKNQSKLAKFDSPENSTVVDNTFTPAVSTDDVTPDSHSKVHSPSPSAALVTAEVLADVNIIAKSAVGEVSSLSDPSSVIDSNSVQLTNAKKNKKKKKKKSKSSAKPAGDDFPSISDVSSTITSTEKKLENSDFSIPKNTISPINADMKAGLDFLCNPNSKDLIDNLIISQRITQSYRLIENKKKEIAANNKNSKGNKNSLPITEEKSQEISLSPASKPEIGDFSKNTVGQKSSEDQKLRYLETANSLLPKSFGSSAITINNIIDESLNGIRRDSKLDMEEDITKIDMVEENEKIDMEEESVKVDIDGVIAKIDIDEDIAKVDMEENIAKFNMEEDIAKVDMEEEIAKVDMEEEIAKVDMEVDIAKVDMEENIAKVDMDEDIPILVSTDTNTQTNNNFSAITPQSIVPPRINLFQSATTLTVCIYHKNTDESSTELKILDPHTFAVSFFWNAEKQIIMTVPVKHATLSLENPKNLKVGSHTIEVTLLKEIQVSAEIGSVEIVEVSKIMENKLAKDQDSTLEINSIETSSKILSESVIESSSTQLFPSLPPRFDFYQSDSTLTISLYKKKIVESSLELKVTDSNQVIISFSDEAKKFTQVNFSVINTILNKTSLYPINIGRMKIEIKLLKDDCKLGSIGKVECFTDSIETVVETMSIKSPLIEKTYQKNDSFAMLQDGLSSLFIKKEEESTDSPVDSGYGEVLKMKNVGLWNMGN